MTDHEIAERVRRLDRARQAHIDKVPFPDFPDEEARRVYQELWTEYWSIGEGLSWILGRDES